MYVYTYMYIFSYILISLLLLFLWRTLTDTTPIILALVHSPPWNLGGACGHDDTSFLGLWLKAFADVIRVAD